MINMPRRRIHTAFFMGLAAGVAVLFIFLALQAIQFRREASAAEIRQENLLSARGEAYDSFILGQARLTVLLDGKPQSGMSVAADQGYWQIPQDGVITLSLSPGIYQFTAGFGNRSLFFTGEIFAGEASAFVLDIGKAPSATELCIIDLADNGSAAIPLEISAADEVSAMYLPQGVSISTSDGGFVMMIADGSLKPGINFIRLTASNQHGQAFSYICLRVARNQAVTPIYTAEDLDRIRNNLSGSYVLMNDIDMSDVHNWVPIGTESYPFSGKFDGGGYEIIGFHAPDEVFDVQGFALFGCVKNAELADIIFRQPVITPLVPARDVGQDFRSAVLACSAVDSLIERCASLGGMVSPSDGLAGGLITGAALSVVRDCFNSADVICNMLNAYLPNTGGIAGGLNIGYVSGCANEGQVKGNHLSGGIAGHAASTDIVRCVNSGYIWGSTIVGAVPAGGIMQSNDGGSITDCYFVRGQSAIGAHSNGGYVASVVPINADDLAQSSKLTRLGAFDGEFPRWAYASLDANGPVPYGIFKRQTDTPSPTIIGGSVELLPREGVVYYYTLDGTDPRMSCAQPAAQLNLALRPGQILTVFAARQGWRDSDTITVTGG